MDIETTVGIQTIIILILNGLGFVFMGTVHEKLDRVITEVTKEKKIKDLKNQLLELENESK